MTTLLAFGGISVAVLITSFISGILGMAGGMILIGILLALLPLSSAMMLHGITQIASNGARAWLWRSSIDRRVLRGSTCGGVLALCIFSLLQLSFSAPAVSIMLGLTPFISYLVPSKLALNVDKRGHSFSCGLVSVSMQLLSGVSGPLLDVYFLQSRMDRRAVVATKAAAQTIGHCFKILYFGVLLARDPGRIEWWVATTMVALAIAGTNLSRQVLESMTDQNFRSWTRTVVTLIGAYYLLSGLRSYL